MPFLMYRDKMGAEGPNQYPYILGMALNQYRLDTDDHYLHYIAKPLIKNIFEIMFVAVGLYTDLLPCSHYHEIFPYSHEYPIF